MKLASTSFPCFVAFIASSFHISHALTNIVVSWGIPLQAGTPYPNQKAQVGDTVTFRWGEGSINDVHIYPSGRCDEDESIFVGDDFAGTSYRFKEEDVGQLFFTSDIPGRCDSGQSITFLVSESDVSPTNLVIDSSSVTTISTYFDFVYTLWDGVGAELPDTFGNPFVFEDDPNTLVQLFALQPDQIGAAPDKEEEDERGFFARVIACIFRIVTLPFRLVVGGINAIFGTEIGVGAEDAADEELGLFGRIFALIFRIITLPFRVLFAGVTAVVNPVLDILGVGEDLMEDEMGGAVEDDGVWIFARFFTFIFRVISLPFRLLFSGVTTITGFVGDLFD